MSRQVITKAMTTNRGAKGIDPAQTPDPYTERLLKLIPAEVVAVYIGSLQWMNSQHSQLWVFWMVFVALGVLNMLYKKRAGVVDWRQYLIVTVAYVIWVFSLGGPIPDLMIANESAKSLGAILVPIYTLVVPFIYQ